MREGLLNYLALLGWSIGDDREIFSVEEMAAAFDVTRVNPNPARFDPRKAEAINGVWLRRLPAEELASRMVLPPVGRHPCRRRRRRTNSWFCAATPLVQERMSVLAESVGMLGFLFADGPVLSRDVDAFEAVRTPRHWRLWPPLVTP